MLGHFTSFYFAAAAISGGIVSIWLLLSWLTPRRALRTQRQDESDDTEKLELEALTASGTLHDLQAANRPRQTEAIEILTRLRGINDPRFPFILGALRKMNAYAFEELLAICLAERGLDGYCSPSYSHDGGVDGLAFYEGRVVVVQAKRWRRHISARDVRALSKVAERVAGIGLFVHTGRTGRASWRAARKHQVNILSGGDLVDLVLGRAVSIRWEIPALQTDVEPLPGHLHSALEFARQVPAAI